MRRPLSLSLCTAVLVTATASAATASHGAPSDFSTHAGSFADDDGNVHEANIESLAAGGVTDGCGSDAFCPHSPVTRGQMAKFLVRAFGLPPASRDYFTDDEDSIFEADINRIRAAGITSGCNPPANDHYCPTQAVTRGQMAVFIIEALGRNLTSQPEDHFTDDDQSIFERHIDELRNAQVTSGCNPPANDRFCPEAPVTRAQMATFLTKAAGLPKQADPTPFGNSTCEAAYSPCVPTVAEVGDLHCDDIRQRYPDGVEHDDAFHDPHLLNTDNDDMACEPAPRAEDFGDFPDDAFVLVYEYPADTADHHLYASFLLTDADVTIDWGDGTVTTHAFPDTQRVAHDYPRAGTYDVQVRGTARGLMDARPGWTVLAVPQWGDLGLTSVEYLLGGTSRADLFVPNHTRGLESVTSMEAMFMNSQFDADLSGWDTSGVTNMQYMFYGVPHFGSDFGGDVSAWDTSSVTNMEAMFYGAVNMNVDLSNWETSRVTDCTTFAERASSWVLPKPQFVSCSP